ncbi:hypothetical protein VULLAG_LOCUS9254 [Vulpes lagopus]
MAGNRRRRPRCLRPGWSSSGEGRRERAARPRGREEGRAGSRGGGAGRGGAATRRRRPGRHLGDGQKEGHPGRRGGSLASGPEGGALPLITLCSTSQFGQLHVQCSIATDGQYTRLGSTGEIGAFSIQIRGAHEEPHPDLKEKAKLHPEILDF